MKNFILFAIVVGAVRAICPNGFNIIRRGVDEVDKSEILKLHAKYRDNLMNGNIPGQPQGVDLLPLEWDDYLAANAQFSTSACQHEIRVGNDDRWELIGQNILRFETAYDAPADWESVIFDWFYEYREYNYPGNDGSGMNYEQMVWANTTYVGCDYLEFLSNETTYPYESLYVCNYAPGGNILGEEPYYTVE